MLLAMKAFGAQPCQAMAEDAGLMQRLREFQADAVMVLGIPVSAIGEAESGLGVCRVAG